MSTAAATVASHPRALLWALAVTLVATAWFALQPDDSLTDTGASAPQRTASSRIASRAPAAFAASAAQWPASFPDARRAAWPARGDSATSPWSPPPAPGPAVPLKEGAAEASVAAAVIPVPKFPFSYIGRWEEGGTQQVLLLGPSRVWAVAPGGVVDGQWRLDRIDATSLVVTYLPHGAAMTVSLQAAPAKPS